MGLYAGTPENSASRICGDFGLTGSPDASPLHLLAGIALHTYAADGAKLEAQWRGRNDLHLFMLSFLHRQQGVPYLRAICSSRRLAAPATISALCFAHASLNRAMVLGLAGFTTSGTKTASRPF